MAVIIIIFIAILIGFCVKSTNDANRRDAERKAAEERIAKNANKEKMRNNKILQMAVECIVEHLQKNIKNAKNVTLDNKTRDFFVGNICKDDMYYREGLKKGNRPHVSPSEDWHYSTYSLWFHDLKFVSCTKYSDSGYSELSGHTMVLFLEVLSEELKKRGCPTWNESYYDYDSIGSDVLLIWDLTPYHPQKELNSFL